jgi:hypothetical protein
MEFIPFPFQIGACPHHCPKVLLSLNSLIEDRRTEGVHSRYRAFDGAGKLLSDLRHRSLMQWAECSASSGARSLANAVLVARTVLEDVDMDVVGMRFVGAWAEHGRESAATRFADRIDCSAGIT